ncbi:MAG: DUF433 domain-containing protein [Chloroflexota bacterium]
MGLSRQYRSAGIDHRAIAKRPFGDACIRGYGVKVWTIISYLRVTNGNTGRVATAHRLPREELEAAVTYYNRH